MALQLNRVLIIDDHPLMRRGLRELLAAGTEFEVAGEAGGRSEALLRAGSCFPDLALLDLSLESISEGIELLKELHEAHPSLPVLVISMHDERIYAERVLRAGARGFVGKHEPPEVFLERMRTVLRGGLAVSMDVASSLASQAASARGHARRRSRGAPDLSDRELEIFSLIGEGVSVREIAQRLGVSPKTIETHRERIKVKLELSSSNELIARAVRFLLESSQPHLAPRLDS
jgi:DNA-binding NarL/FixJ family response regulator